MVLLKKRTKKRNKINYEELEELLRNTPCFDIKVIFGDMSGQN